MQQPGRLRLRPWLEEQIQSGRYPGVSWLDQVDPLRLTLIPTNTYTPEFMLCLVNETAEIEKKRKRMKSARIFQIPWKHAARHGWSIDRDATLFRSWAMHTGRYRPGKDEPDPKTWKANFRCALNSLPDVCELREHSRKRGSNAYRVYRMLPSSQRRRRRGLQFLNKPRERPTSLEECTRDDTFTMHTWQPATTRTISDTPQKVETSAQNTFNSIQGHGMWESKPEDQEQSDAVFKLMDHLGSTDLWNQTGEQRGWKSVWDQWQYAGDENPYLLHADNHSDIFGHNYIKEHSDWTTHQQTLI